MNSTFQIIGAEHKRETDAIFDYFKDHCMNTAGYTLPRRKRDARKLRITHGSVGNPYDASTTIQYVHDWGYFIDWLIWQTQSGSIKCMVEKRQRIFR